jgi:glycosyltransferase involved in cell wall biosynthesis
VEALEGLGCDVMEYNLNDRLIFYNMALIDTGEKDEEGLPLVRSAMTREQAWLAAMQGLSHMVLDMDPDIILFISAFFASAVTLRLLRRRGYKVVILHTECPYQDTEQVMRGAFASLNLVNDPASLPQFQALGPAEYMPHGYRPDIHYPRTGRRDEKLASDFIFIGSAFASRKAFFESMDLTGIDTLIGGADWGSLEPDSPLVPFVGTIQGAPDCVDNPQTAELYRNAKVGINFYRREAEENAIQGVAMGPREVELAACGLFFLRDPRPESDEVFGQVLPAFDSPEDASDKLRFWLTRDGLRDKRAAQAREAIEDRTFANHARRLLKLVERL